jgi:Ni/Co efflux regulator RcnB
MQAFSFGSSTGRYFLPIDNEGVPPMKRLVLSAIAAAMLVVPAVQSQAAPMISPAAPHADLVKVDWRKPSEHRHYNKPPVVKKVVVHKWKRGQRYGDWRKHRAIKDYHRHGLSRPGRGQEWIKVGNDYLLIGIASGIIGAMVAAH